MLEVDRKHLWSAKEEKQTKETAIRKTHASHCPTRPTEESKFLSDTLQCNSSSSKNEHLNRNLQKILTQLLKEDELNCGETESGEALSVLQY